MNKEFKKYPIGKQCFPDMVEGKYLYVDKTKYVYELVQQYDYVFLSRPRRFGKSLLVSTLKSYFEGRSDLFKGLAIDSLEKDWVKYPVFHFDMSDAKCQDIEALKTTIHCKLRRYEAIYGACPDSNNLSDRIGWLYEAAYQQTGQKAVVLIDEYDSPMLEVMENEVVLLEFRNFFRLFYSPIKSCSSFIKFVFITGITKFSQLSIFSELNSLAKISMLDEWSGICGITETELLTDLDGELESLALAFGLTKEETFDKLKRQYDGYHFSENSEDVYNPFSLINAFKDKKLSNYWLETGTPQWLINLLRKLHFRIEDLNGAEATREDFDVPTENMTSALPLLYQSGYITIKEYKREENLFLLGMPNTEVRIGLLRGLVPNYVSAPNTGEGVFITKFGSALRKDRVSDALHLMRSYMAGLPYEFMSKGEKSYHFIFFVVSGMLLQYVDSEVKNAAGRSDMLVKTDTHIYLFEFKYNGTLDCAMRQIDTKGYMIPFECDDRELVKVAVNFSDSTRTIESWRIAREGGTVEEWSANDISVF